MKRKARKATKKVCFEKTFSQSEENPEKRRFWKKNILMVVANRPKPRAYLQGCYEGENKKGLICEVSVTRTTQYKKVVQIIKEQCEQKGLTKAEVLELCEKYPSAPEFHMSHEKRAPGWLGYIGDEILPSYIGTIINHYKDPYISLLTNQYNGK